MRYVVCETPGKLVMKKGDVPISGPGEVLVRVRAIGVCGTDLHAYQGNQMYFTYPRILGHELAVEITEDMEEGDLQKGMIAGLMPYISCGSCFACKSGYTNCCTSLSVLGVHEDGGMQDYITVPRNLLLPVAELNLKQTSVIEPLAIGAHAIRRARLTRDDILMVMGCGPIGIGIICQALDRGHRVIAIDTSEDRLTFMNSLSSEVQTINPAKVDLSETLNTLTSGQMPTVAFDATGNQKAIETAPEYIAHGGTFVIVGLHKGTLHFSHPVIHGKELSILSSRNATLSDFKEVIRFLKTGGFPIDKYVSHEVGFEDIDRHFKDWKDRPNGLMKALIYT